ncbi:MAG: PAS domain S-box protein [Candidatus Sulfobium sp.]|jgi:two-component system CheB/CheR fusion protein
MEPKLRTDDRKPGAEFPIVGIGASAGGLNSLQCFIAALPKEFGFAVVFVQHLSTKHKSLLPDLLHSRRPDLHIEEIAEGMEVFPGRLYLCAPGREMKIEQGVFRVTAPTEGHVHFPIDEFLVSLAEDAGERATAVIFSGAGTDGARGVKTVRAMGGNVFVQDPETAEFPGMPLSAVNTGQVDRVLPPEDIAREVLKTLSVREEELITPLEVGAILGVIYEKTGCRFNHYKKSVVSRRVRRRMYLHGISSVKEYMDIVADKDEEASALASDMMIGVTSFFRDRVAWKALKIEAVRKLVAADKAGPIRVWSPACATGEEAYSIAMMLSRELELAGRKREVQVFATDVNDRALEKAREGKYPGSITADIPADYIKRFFTCSEDGISVIINKEVRERVVFARQDLLSDPPFSRLDLVICRNFLIYLEPDAQEKCIALFHYALVDGGYLFLGNAESANRSGDLFKSVGHKKCRVYLKIGTAGSSRPPLGAPFAEERTISSSSQRTEAEERRSLVGFVQGALLEEYAPAAVAIDQNHHIVYSNGPTNRYLRQPRGAPTQSLLELLPEKLRSRIRGALYRVTSEGRPVSIRTGIEGDDGNKRGVLIRLSKLTENLFLVVFRQKDDKKGVPSERTGTPCEAGEAEETAVRQLESELAATRDALQSNIEQLKSLNEEQQSSNEELYAANEELETSREELQSLNEELITVNAQLQSKIEEQEGTNNDLNNFLASTNIPTVFLDHQLRVKRFTPAMSRLIKLIPADAGRPIADMSRDHLGPDLMKDSRAVLEHLSPRKREFRVGNTWYIRTILPYRTSDNRIEGVVITYTDTSDLRRAEVRTRHLASFPQLDPNPIIEVDSSGKIIFSNGAAQEVLEVLGMDSADCSVFLPADFDGILKELGRKEGKTFRREISIKDRVFSESVHLVPQSDAVRIYAFDITERKRGEELRGRLSAIVQSAEDAIISKDLDGVIQTWNVGAEKIFGYAAEEVIGKNISILVPPGRHDEVPDILRRIAKGEHIERYETLRRRKDGKIIPVSLTYSPIRDANGKVVAASKIAHDISDRKNTEETLRESEGRLRAALESAEMGTWDVDVERGTVDWDVRCRNIFGLPDRGTVPLEVALSRIVEEDRDRVRKKIEAAVAPSSDGKYDIEYRVLGLGDRLQWIRATGQTFFEGSGEDRRAKRFIGVVMDMTERRRAEEALRESEEQFRTVADAIPQLCWTADADGYITWYNKRWYEYTGTTPEQMEGWGWQMVHDPEVLPEVMEKWKESIASGEPFEMEFPIRGADGIFRTFLTRILPLKDTSGRVLKWFGTNTDISTLKKAGEELKKSLGRFELLTTTAGELLQSSEPQKAVESVCRKVMEHLDCDAFFNFLVDEEAGRLHLNAWAGIPEGEAKKIEWLDVGSAICGCVAADGRRIVAEHIASTADERTDVVKSYGINAYCCHPLLGPGGKVIGTLSFGTCNRETFSEEDLSLMKAITDQVAVAVVRMRNEADVLKLGEEMAARNVELETVNNELESFIYSISHDLRAPLRSMAGFARILIEDYTETLDQQGLDYLARIHRGSEKMTRLIDDLLHLSKISRQEIERADVDVTKMAHSVVSELREGEPGRSVEVVIQDGLSAVADRRLTEIVLSNLLGNSWKFTSGTDNARIEFGAFEREDGQTVFYVKDNGAGFDPDYAEKMFWPFQRLHSEKEFPGTGIGLTIVERIIRRHGGKIWAEGGIGKGAAFYFTVE